MLLPLASFNASRLDDLTTTQDATGSRDASLSGSSNTNLKGRSMKRTKEVDADALGCVVIVGNDFLELEVNKSFGIKWTLELGWLGGCTQERTTAEIEIRSNTDDPGPTKVQRNISVTSLSCRGS